VALKYNGAFKPVISLNTMQNTVRVEKTDFPENARFSIFGQSPIPPTQDVKVHFNSSREDSKTPISIFAICFGFPKLPLIASGGLAAPGGYALIMSNSVRL